MTFDERFQDPNFINNQAEIESDWDSTYGDRKNEIVFIGQHMNEALMRANLEACLATEAELAATDWEGAMPMNGL